MISFFRRIRKSLLGPGQARKYLLYAIGEIALVVIGILIALQINNWNEWRQDRDKERIIINSLRQELKANEEYLIDRLNSYTNNVNGCRKLLELTGPDPPDLAYDDFDSLVNRAVRRAAFNPESADLDRIIGSEDFNLIRFDSLKSALRKYAVLIDHLRNHEDWRLANARNFSDNQQRGYSSKTIINYGQTMNWDEFKGLGTSRFQFDPALSLSDPLFEKDIANLLQIIHYTKNRTTDVLDQLEGVQYLIYQYYEIDSAPLFQKDPN